MRCLGLLKADASSEAGEPPSPEMMARMGPFLEEVTKAGVLLATDGLKPSSFGKRVRVADGKVTVTDGPFIETKELVASYALFDVNSIDEAVFWTTKFLHVLGEGECEIRPIFGPDDFPADVFPPHDAAREDAAREEATREAMRKNADKR